GGPVGRVPRRAAPRRSRDRQRAFPDHRRDRRRLASCALSGTEDEKQPEPIERAHAPAKWSSAWWIRIAGEWATRGGRGDRGGAGVAADVDARASLWSGLSARWLVLYTAAWGLAARL